MFGGGGGGGGGDFWAGLPTEPAPPAYPSPAPPFPFPFPFHFPLPQYHPAFTPPPPAPPEAWSAAENRVFEAALVEFEESTPDRWQRIAGRIPGKSPWDVAEQYRRLERDVQDIEAGVVELPKYADDCPARAPQPANQQQGHISFGATRAKTAERNKGKPWTGEEHKRFLEGLDRFGKGDWRSISRMAVITRTPTQVASHAQKYFLRQSAGEKKERRRSSIHDVTRP